MSAPEKVVSIELARAERAAAIKEAKKKRRARQRNLLYECFAPVILPDIAIEKGLPYSAVLQKIYYWVRLKRNKISPRPPFEAVEIYNSIAELQLDLPFWSDRTIENAIRDICNDGLMKIKRKKVRGDNVICFRLLVNVFDAKHRKRYEDQAAERYKQRKTIATNRRFQGKQRDDIW